MDFQPGRYFTEAKLQPSLQGFRNFLIGKLYYLDQQTRLKLASNLDKHGWPLHLTSLEAASWQLASGGPWTQEDYKVLILLSKHDVNIEDIAEVFYEGRTVFECQMKLDHSLDIYEARLPVKSVEQEVREHRETSIPKSSVTVPSSTLPPTADSPAKPAALLAAAGKAATPAKKRLNEAGSRSETPHSDSQKIWDQKDRDTLWKAVSEGLNGRQIQEQLFPFRSEGAINTRISKERKLRGAQKTPNKPPNDDNAQPSRAEAVEVNVGASRAKDGEDAQIGAQDVNMDAQGEPDSDYEDEGSQTGPQTPKNDKYATARKTPVTPSSTTKTKTPPSSISPIRTKLLNSIDANLLPKEDKERLKKVLGRNNWPVRFASIDDHNSPLPGKGAKWKEQDTKALVLIHETLPKLPVKALVAFFPGRTEASVSNQLRYMRDKKK